MIGRAAVPLIVAAEHQVTAVARSSGAGAWAKSVGAVPAEVDLFDPEAVTRAVAGHHVVAHFATAIPPLDKMTKREEWAMNDRLRTEATRNLVDASLESGVERFIQESITFIYADGGSDWIDEDSPVDPVADILSSVLVAEEETGRFAASGGTGVVLRLSRLYGPEASAAFIGRVAAGKLPLVGRGDNYVSSLHTDDAGSALVAALGVRGGIYNVSDDEPVTTRDVMTAILRALGKRGPSRVPAWLARTVAGEAVNMTAISHRISNRRFKGATGWRPAHVSVTTGWPVVIAAL